MEMEMEMEWTQARIDAVRAKNHRIYFGKLDLECDLREILNSPKHKGLCNECKAEVLLELENNGEYDPLG
tara:strand:- start:429 stop:638 length:210 start_codon:yes stop_codon:yes gene_type:complete